MQKMGDAVDDIAQRRYEHNVFWGGSLFHDDNEAFALPPSGVYQSNAVRLFEGGHCLSLKCGWTADGKASGRGTLTFRNSANTYQSRWSDAEECGRANRRTYTAGQLKVTALFGPRMPGNVYTANGAKSVKIVYPNGDVYTGLAIRGREEVAIPCGAGSFVSKGAEPPCTGSWDSNGRRHGMFECERPGGTREQSLWDSGSRMAVLFDVDVQHAFVSCMRAQQQRRGLQTQMEDASERAAKRHRADAQRSAADLCDMRDRMLVERRRADALAEVLSQVDGPHKEAAEQAVLTSKDIIELF